MTKRSSIAAMLLAAVMRYEVSSAVATDFIADSPMDAPDAAPGDGVCADSSGHCTLRAAIDEANAIGRGVISAPLAQYKLRAPLVISGNATLVGSGMGKMGTLIRGGLGITAVHVLTGGILATSDLTIGYSSHSDETEGGCILNDGQLALMRTQVKRCKALLGGGLFNRGVAHIGNSIFYGNHCAPAQGPVDAGGAAVYNVFGADLVVENTFLAYNRTRSIAQRNRGCPHGASGGGAFHNDGTLTVVNTTVWHNRSRRSCGGGLMNAETGDAMLTNCTFSQNHGAFGSGGVVNLGVVRMVNTIVAHSLTTEGFGVINCFGNAPISLGHNLETGHECKLTGTGDRSGVAAYLCDPRDNGGPTYTMGLLPGSPAIDAGDDWYCPPTDQRGAPRPMGSQCDIGAYESPGSLPPPTSTLTPMPTATSTPTATLTEAPVDTPTQTPTGTPTDTPTDTPAETPTPTSMDQPAETPAETPTA